MKEIQLQKLQKKAQADIGNNIKYLIGGLIVVVAATSLAPDMFSNLSGLNESGAPDWVYTIGVLAVGMGIVFLILRAFDVV